MFLYRQLIVLAGIFYMPFLHAQISPPGMDDTNAVTWGAAGISQQVGKKWAVKVYAGTARESDPDNWSFLHKQAILVVNQETQYRFNKKWQLALCSSLRKQNRYMAEEPYTASDPSLRDELRYYLRLYYRTTAGKFNIAYSLRPELRFFYDNRGNHWSSSPEEFRLRFKIQASMPLNNDKSNQVIVTNEWLGAMDEKRNSEGELRWSRYVFTEDRLTMYWRHVFKNMRLIFDIGIMHQVKFADKQVEYIPHLAFDFICLNPFGIPKTLK
jgi:hypothetical protein